MSTYTCKHCGHEKPADEMTIRAGKPSKTCRACWSAKMAKRSGKANAAPPLTEPPETAGTLVIPAGHGLSAELVEGDGLSIVQGDDNIVLTRFEALRLFSTFNEWANS